MTTTIIVSIVIIALALIFVLLQMAKLEQRINNLCILVVAITESLGSLNYQ